jgi:hypothetical protein
MHYRIIFFITLIASILISAGCTQNNSNNNSGQVNTVLSVLRSPFREDGF